LLRKKAGEYIVCPKCESPLHVTQQACPYCGSSNIQKEKVIEHYGCGYVAFEEEFLQPDGSLKCPSCGKTLKSFEEEYRLIENVFRCKSCGSFFETEMVYICIK